MIFLQLGGFVSRWGQLVPAELHSLEVIPFPQAGSWQNWLSRVCMGLAEGMLWPIMSREVTGRARCQLHGWGVQTACLQWWELLGSFVSASNASTSAVIPCAPPPCVKSARAGSP